MSPRSILVLVVVLWAVAPASAQRIFERKRPEIFPTDGKMRRGGFYVAPGLTYTLTRTKDREQDLGPLADTVYSAIYRPKGSFGPYLEAGWFQAVRDPYIIDYWDVGLAYKQLSGKEEFVGTFSYGDSIRTWVGDGRFTDRHITLHANANKLIQTTDHGFVQLTLGANADYRLSTSRETSGLQIAEYQEFPPELIAQVHFKVGYGFKVNKRLMIIPALETPVFSAVPFDDGRFGAMQWFSSRYRPLIFSVRFLFLRYPKGYACPPAIKHNALEGGKVKQYKPDSYHP